MMAAVSGSRRRFCAFSENIDSRRAADGFCVRLAKIYLEGLESGLAVGCTKARRVTGSGEGQGRCGERAIVGELGRTGGWVTRQC